MGSSTQPLGSVIQAMSVLTCNNSETATQYRAVSGMDQAPHGQESWALAPSPVPFSAGQATGFSVTRTHRHWARAEVWNGIGDSSNGLSLYNGYAMWFWLKRFPAGRRESKWEENNVSGKAHCRIAAAVTRQWHWLRHWGTGLKT